MKLPKDCEHENLMFGSGDYYIFCQDCSAGWVRKSLTNDQPDASLANKGVGGTLSGHTRKK